MANNALPNPLPVTDTDQILEVLEDQPGDDSVLTFTFTEPSSAWVYVNDGNPVRVTDSTQTPTFVFGIPVAAGSPFPVPAKISEVRVYAATGQTVTVYGTR